MLPDRGWAATMRAKIAVCLFFALLPAAVCAENLVVPRDIYEFIGGLAFVDVDDPAESYYFLSTKKKVAGRGKVRTKAIESMYDGTGGYYVCVDGKWATRFVH